MDSEFYKQQKELLADLFGQAQAYTNLVIVAGYAGSFTAWSYMSNRLAPATGLLIGLLLSLSLATYIAWEIYGLIQKQIALSSLRKSVDDFERYSLEVASHQQKNQLILRRLERYWPVAIGIAVGSAGLAILALLSAFCDGLVSDLWPKVSVKGQADVSAIFIALGGLCAGIIGWQMSGLEARAARKRGRKHLAAVLRDELVVSAKLFDELAKTWKESAIILFDILDQVDYSRAAYESNRARVPILDDSDIQNRLTSYYRETYLILRRLREWQMQIHELERAKVLEDEQLKLVDVIQERRGWIEDKLQDLDDSRLRAIKIADQLFIRF